MQEATVTRAEMIEHAFYQALNLLQILFFHALHHPALHAPLARTVAVLVVTAPWLLRHYFPVNHFSANYRTAVNPWGTVSVLYGTLHAFVVSPTASIHLFS